MSHEEELWRGKVARYRKHEQRHDRAVNLGLRETARRILATFYVELSNEAREIVTKAGRNPHSVFVDTPDFMRDETITRVTGPVANYRLKRRNAEPTRLWFQRFEHEPWFDLGYVNEAGEFQDKPPSTKNPYDIAGRSVSVTGRLSPETMRQLQDQLNVTRNRVERHRIKERIFTDIYSGGTKPITHTDHIHVGPGQLFVAPLGTTPNMDGWKEVGYTTEDGLTTSNEENNDMIGHTDNADELDEAAARFAARASELRRIDATEPAGDEPTITWTWTPGYEGATTYTYVAFKAGNGRWYVTGEQINRPGLTWRDLYGHNKAENIRKGRYHLVTEWTYQGSDEDTDDE